MNEDKKWSFKWPSAMVLSSLLLAVALTGCGDSSANESNQADENASAQQTNNEEVKKEDLPTAEELEEEVSGDIEHPLRDLVDITEEVTIKEVVDGDTLVVDGENGEETIQLALVRTPEKTLPDGTPDEYYGFKSNEYTNIRLSEGKTVLMERGEPETDQDGNTRAYIWLKNNSDHVNYNEMMLREGIGRLVSSESDAKYLDEFQEAEAEAKAEKVNIWSIDGYVTDDGFDSSLVQ